MLKHNCLCFFVQLMIFNGLFVTKASSNYCQLTRKCMKRSSFGDLSYDYDYISSTGSSNFTLDYAERDVTKTDNSTSANQGIGRPCCKACICSRNCVKQESCCFPELTHTFVDNSIETCTYAQSPVPHVDIRYSIPAYYMVDRNPRDGCRDKEFYAQHPREDCGNVSAADWGSLYPVSSASTGKIYKNIHCAVCHGVTDGNVWQASIKNCKLPSSFRILSLLTDELVHGKCIINFTNTDDTFNVQERSCFSGKIINYCPSINFYVPESLNMNTNKVALACQNGEFSPYIHKHVYANIFCLICNSDLRNLDKNQMNLCQSGTPGFEPFTAIIVPRIQTWKKKERHKLACTGIQYPKIIHKCRPVFCQSGTSFIAGECRHVIEIVYNSDFLVNIVLLPASSINISIDFRGMPELLNYFKQTWGDEWHVEKVSVSRNTTYEVETMLVTLIYNTNGNRVSIIKLINQIKYSLNNDSQLTVASLHKVVYFKQFNTLGRVAISQQHINELIASVDYENSKMKETLNTSRTYNTVYTNLMIQNEVTTISRMFYCEQVELYQDEYVLLSTKVVYIKHMKVLLYEGQFIIIPKHEGLESKIRICLNESGFSLNISSSSVRTVMVTSAILGLTVLNVCVLYLLAIIWL